MTGTIGAKFGAGHGGVGALLAPWTVLILTALAVPAEVTSQQSRADEGFVQASGMPAPDTTEAADTVPVLAEAASAQQDTIWRDAWGQPKNFGLAAVETYLGNFLPWAFNEIVPSRRDLKISQISPRSWWRNLEEGWKWDDNKFQVNFFSHPFQGSIYFNSGRSNGYGYWQSLMFATAGSFNWECCGETHFMSINDWVMTSIGGAAVGEVLYRSGSMILDNEATGGERFLREAAAFLITPTRGFTRLVTGNATRVYANPTNSDDHVPDLLESSLTGGVRKSYSRRSSDFATIDDDVPTHAFINFDMTYGSQTSFDRSKPFDYFRFGLQANFIKGRALGTLEIEGSLWHKPLSETDGKTTNLLAVQNFEYENNSAFEQGGQGATLKYVTELRPSDVTTIRWDVGGSWMLLGGVKSELAFLADVDGIRERWREYDFGIGPGARARFEWRRHGRRLFETQYRFQYLKTLNGSAREGYGSNHIFQVLRVHAVLPWEVKGFGLGADFEGYYRRSDFAVEEIGLVRQEAGLWQIFLTYNPRRNVR